MKKLALCLIVMILLAACKKDKEEISLKGKWTVENSTTKYYQNGVLVNTVTETFNRLTWEFNSEGNLIRRGGLFTDSQPYKIMPDSRVDIDGEIFEIGNLTRSAVTLIKKTENGPGTYKEFALNLKK
jgi:hypothetical protein